MSKKGNEVDKIVKGEIIPKEIKAKSLSEAVGKFDAESLAEELSFSDIKTEIPLTLLERYVSELFLKGYSHKTIAEQLNVSPAVVGRTLNSKPVKAFVKQASKEIKENIKNETIALMRRTVRDKINHIEEAYDGDFSKATRKDLPDLLKLLDDMLKEEEKTKLGTNQNVFVQILNQVTDK